MNDLKIALTLSGGGARGAYQVGVLRAIQEICHFQECPFRIVSGISAGSINGMAIAAGAENFQSAVELLWKTWINLKVENIFETQTTTLIKTGIKWIADLSLGAWSEGQKITHLLETEPLKKALMANIDMSQIEKQLEAGRLHAVAISVTDYFTGKSVAFFEGHQSVKQWNKNSGFGQRTRLKIEHIMASTAIPIVFPPVKIENSTYGDGGIGLRAPLSPAIRLGAERILVIGLESEPTNRPNKSAHRNETVTMGEIAGTLLNSLFLNSLDADVERLKQTNKVLAGFTPEQLATEDYNLRQIPVLFIRPSRDLGDIDRDQFSKFPFTVRHLLKGLGVSEVKGWDLLSYLAFDKSYTEVLLELGYADGIRARKEIIEFFKPNPPVTKILKN